VVLCKMDVFRGLYRAQIRKISPLPLQEVFSAKDFILKHVRVREFYMSG
jgi:hypothetical protein